MLAGVQRGILGGTFDPPHVAHLMVGEVAYRDLHLDVVTFVPAGAPWQKSDRKVSSADDRWNMTVLATEGIEYFSPDEREVHRDGWTYTFDTLVTFPEEDEITLILGADAALGLPSWHRYEEVLARARIAVMGRPGVDASAVDAAVPSGVEWLDAPPLAISGTLVRDRVGRGRSVRFLVRDAVWRYIQENRLYEDV